MSDPVHPDQPYTPSTDEVREVTNTALRESYLYAQLHVRGHHTDELGTKLTVSLNKAFDRFFASVRRDAQAEQRETDLAIVDEQYLLGDAENDAYNEAINDVVRALRKGHPIEHDHDPGGCTCGCPVPDCRACGDEPEAAIRRNENGDTP